MAKFEGLLGKRKRQEEELKNFLEADYPSPETVRPSIESARTAGLSSLVSRIPSRYQSGAQTGISSRTGDIQARTDEFLAQQKFNQQRQRINLIYNNALEMAQQSGYDRRSAEAFAQQKVQDEENRAFRAEQGEFQRQRSIKQQQNKLKFGQGMIDIESAYQPKIDYTASLIAALVGTGASIGTAAYLGREGKQPNISSGNPISFRQNLPQDSLTARTGFTQIPNGFKSGLDSLYPRY